MKGTKVVIHVKNQPKIKKVLYFLGVPKQYQLYLMLKDDVDFCPFPMDNDNDLIRDVYDNVTVDLMPMDIMSTSLLKVDFAKQVFQKAPDEIVPHYAGLPGEETAMNKYIWNNVSTHKSQEVIAAIGGYTTDIKTYILFEEPPPEHYQMSKAA